MDTTELPLGFRGHGWLSHGLKPFFSTQPDCGALKLARGMEQADATRGIKMTMMHTTRTIDRPQAALSARTVWLVFAVLWAAIYFASLFSPPLLDDVDASHAQAAQHMAESGDLITAKTNGIRYIEKPPLPYWVVAGMYKVLLSLIHI